MAIVAGDFPMTAEKLVVCIPVMTKIWFCPTAAIVAIAALTAVMFVMFIIFKVTRRAGLLQSVFERVFRMTVIACKLSMLARQSKICVT